MFVNRKRLFQNVTMASKPLELRDLHPFQCPVCIHYYDDYYHMPVRTICGHTFCFSHRNTFSNDMCPVCGKCIRNRFNVDYKLRNNAMKYFSILTETKMKQSSQQAPPHTNISSTLKDSVSSKGISDSYFRFEEMIPENGFIFSSDFSHSCHLSFPIRFIWSNVSNRSLIAAKTIEKLGLLDFPQIKASLNLSRSKKDQDNIIIETTSGDKVTVEGKIQLFVQLHDVYLGGWEFFIYSSSTNAKFYDMIIGNDFVKRTGIKPYHFEYVSTPSPPSKKRNTKAVIRPF
jgi:rubredoxin